MLTLKTFLVSFSFFSITSAEIGQDYKIRLLRRLCLVIGFGQVLGSLVLCGLWLINDQILFLYSTTSSLLAILAYLVSYRLAEVGHYTWGSRLLVLSTSLPILVQSWLMGSHAPIIVAFMLVIVLAIVLLQTWEALLVASFCIGFSIALNVLVELLHWYTPLLTINLENEESIISIIAIAIIVPLTVALLIISTRSLIEALHLQNQRLQAALAKQEQSQAAIYELERNYRQLFMGNPQPMWVYDAESLAFLAVNEAAVQHYGYSREEFLAMTIKDIRPTKDVPALIEQTSQESLKFNAAQNWRHYKKDRSLIEVEISRHSLKFAGREARAVLIHDVTERKQTEAARQKAQEALRQSEERLKQIISVSHDMIWDWDLETNYIWRSEGIQTVLGYAPEEIENSAAWWDERVHPEDWAGLHETSQRIIESDKQFWQKEYRFRRGDGSYAYISERAYIIRDAQGKAQRLVGATSDISQRKAAEEALRQSEELYRTLVRNFPNGIVALFDRDLRFALVEGSELAKIGRTREYFEGKTIWEAFSPAYVQQLEPAYRAALAGETKSFEFVFGSLFYLVYALPIKNEQGEVFAGMVVTQNITERRRAEEAVRQSEARYRAIIEDQTELVCRTDLEGRFTFVNGAYCRYFEKSGQELIGQDFMSFVLPEDREIIKKHKLGLGQENPNTVYEQRVIKPNGEIGWQQWTDRAIFDEQGHFVEFQAVGRDITDKKMMEQELLKVQKLESVGLLAGGIAHDFNNILTGVLGNISLAKLNVEEQTESHELLDEAELAALRAKNLTQQLLTFSKGGSPIRKAASLKNLLEESVNFVLRGSNVRCQFTIAADLWSVEIDEGQISQVISNIVINADQAMPQGGIIRIEVSNIPAARRDRSLPLKEGDYVQVTIRDEGTGIPEKNLSRIFDPYFTTKQRGSGLGLATSFSIMTKHDGFIRVQSQPGQGTVFILYLPAIPGNKPMSPPATSAEKTRPRPERRRVLVMDDEEIILKVLKRTLEKNSYTVDAARDGREAVKLYRLALETSQPYEIVIMDLTIPGGMGGKEALKELLALNPKVKAIVASGYSNDPVMARYQEYGFRATLTKPFKATELYQKLEEVSQLLD